MDDDYYKDFFRSIVCWLTSHKWNWIGGLEETEGVWYRKERCHKCQYTRWSKCEDVKKELEQKEINGSKI